MACKVEILDVKGYTITDASSNDVLHTIHIEGRILEPVEDPAIYVASSCRKDVGHPAVIQADGTWWVDIPSNGCNCEEFIMINAWHRLDEDHRTVLCEGDTWEGQLDCEPMDLCPFPVHISATIGDCINGKRQVTLEARIYPNDINAIGWYKWEFGVNIECTVNTTTSIAYGTPTSSGTSTEELTIFPPDGTTVIGNYLIQTTGEILIPAPSNDDVEINVTFTVVGDTQGCSNARPYTLTFPGCGASCPTITDIEVGRGLCNKNLTKRFIFFVPHVDGAGITEYIWDYGDGTTDNNGEHWYDVGTNQTVKLTINGPCTCSHTFEKSFEVLCGDDDRCPEGQDWNPTTQECEEKNGEEKNGFRFKFCCFLIYGWLITFVSIWFTTEIWQAWVSALGTSLTLLIVWFFVCHECGWKFWTKKFWKCINPFTNCCFLRWTILGHELALLVLGWAIALGIYEPPVWIWGVLTSMLGIWSALWYRANCKSYPIVFRPSTWPPCKCRK